MFGGVNRFEERYAQHTSFSKDDSNSTEQPHRKETLPPGLSPGLTHKRQLKYHANPLPFSENDPSPETRHDHPPSHLNHSRHNHR
jgi:hypothetical protein